MSNLKTTLLTNVYNEEYLLPFWLNHHKDMFDDIIIINYYSTDKSMEICKNICPNCKIINTRNQNFGTIDIDNEFMDIECRIEGIKIVLNTTEFLIPECPIKDLFKDVSGRISYSINAISPYSSNNYDIKNYNELFSNLFNPDIKYHNDRGVRQLHNCVNGNYKHGRHETYNYTIPNNKAHIIWFGFYPMNEIILQRKLQVKTYIPQSDIDRRYGFQHFYDREKMLSLNDEKSKTGVSFKEINPSLYNFLIINNKYNGGKYE